MALYTYNGTLIAGLTADQNCCCKSYRCFCYKRFTDYGSTLVERSRVCFQEPFWNGSQWVFPDGQPCDPTKPAPDCTVDYVGIYVVLCSCPGGGLNPYRWDLIDTQAEWDDCTTISPPP